MFVLFPFPLYLRGLRNGYIRGPYINLYWDSDLLHEFTLPEGFCIRLKKEDKQKLETSSFPTHPC